MVNIEEHKNVEKVIRYYLKFLPPKGLDRILDLGCGTTAPYRGILKNRCNELVCADIRPGPKVDIICDITKATSFTDKYFDFVWASEVIEHLDKENQKNAIKEMVRIGKSATITYPTPTYPTFYEDRGHIVVTIDNDFLDSIMSNFKVITTKTGRVIILYNHQ